ncbi:hypothetical protein ABZS96_21950 [Streptomyces avermitilis]|uniref:hypothetical protein n=1 Tax=Streptomyces avermitilis TaxID=33903 RepID=UPI0033ABC7E0
MPQSLLPRQKEKSDPALRLLSLREVLNRISTRVNEIGAKPETSPEGPLVRAGKIATVTTEIGIGCYKPAVLEHVLWALNVNDQLRGIQPYDDDARLAPCSRRPSTRQAVTPRGRTRWGVPQCAGDGPP